MCRRRLAQLKASLVKVAPSMGARCTSYGGAGSQRLSVDVLRLHSQVWPRNRRPTTDDCPNRVAGSGSHHDRMVARSKFGSVVDGVVCSRTRYDTRAPLKIPLVLENSGLPWDD